jgi:hypothetical protein
MPAAEIVRRRPSPAAITIPDAPGLVSNSMKRPPRHRSSAIRTGLDGGLTDIKPADLCCVVT